MLTQGGDCHLVDKQIKKAYQCHPEAFQKFNISPNEIIKIIFVGQ